MYTAPFQVVDIADLDRTMRQARSATLITATPEGLVGTMLPVVLDESERLHGHDLRARGARIRSGSWHRLARRWPFSLGRRPTSAPPGT